MIRQNQDIKGIDIGGTENKICQYADDTELTQEGDRQSFEEAMQVIDIFGNVSGLKLNAGKSSAMWLGNRRNCRVKYMPHLKMEWNPSQFKKLGIWLINNLEECIKINYDSKFREIKALYKVWSKRQLTPIGRVAVLKSLILSKIVFLWILLPNPPEEIVNAIQTDIFHFVWNKKNDRLSRKISHKNIQQGGIGIPDVRKYMNALKVTWIRKLHADKHKWATPIKRLNNRMLFLEKVGTNICVKGYRSKFWSDVFKAYQELGKKVMPEKIEEILAEPLFCNTAIMVGKRSPFLTTWIEKGVYQISHLLDDEGNFFSFGDFSEKLGIHTNFITYMGIVSSVKEYVTKSGMQQSTNRAASVSNVFKLILSTPRGARRFYDKLTMNDVEPNCCRNWDNRIIRNMQWKTIFKKINDIEEIKLKWLQVRIIHRILGTNIIASNINKDGNNKCSFCRVEKESIQHLFWGCPIVQSFWNDIQANINQKCALVNAIHLSEHFVIFGCEANVENDDVIDLFLLIAKQYIYICKMKTELPDFSAFTRILKYRYKIEMYNAKLRMCYDSLQQMWNPYIPLLT